MVDIKELAITAQLARLNVSEDQLTAALPAFEQMIGFFAAMEEAENDSIFSHREQSTPANSQLVGAEHFRTGEQKTDADSGLTEKMLSSAGERDRSFIVIPNVL